ncbi:MAG: hypothetical protein ABIO16_16000, partial [Nocardioides sp.]
KDPVITRDEDGWQLWLCCHPLDDAGHEDRMTTSPVAVRRRRVPVRRRCAAVPLCRCAAVPLGDGRTRYYVEAAREDGAHDLVTLVR